MAKTRKWHVYGIPIDVQEETQRADWHVGSLSFRLNRQQGGLAVKPRNAADQEGNWLPIWKCDSLGHAVAHSIGYHAGMAIVPAQKGG